MSCGPGLRTNHEEASDPVDGELEADVLGLGDGLGGLWLGSGRGEWLGTRKHEGPIGVLCK